MTNKIITSIEMSEQDHEFLNTINVTLPMNSVQFRKYLPHRYPFVMIDRVTAIIPDQTIVGYKNITNNEPFFTGHFPDMPIVPGVLIVEAMAQIAGILGFVSDKEDLNDGLYLFAGVDKVRFKQQVIPGDKLDLIAKTLKVKRNIYKFDCQAFVEDKLAASAEVMLVKQPPQN